MLELPLETPRPALSDSKGTHNHRVVCTEAEGKHAARDDKHVLASVAKLHLDVGADNGQSRQARTNENNHMVSPKAGNLRV